MPVDGVSKVKVKGSKQAGRHGTFASASKEDWDTESNIPAAVRLSK